MCSRQILPYWLAMLLYIMLRLSITEVWSSSWHDMPRSRAARCCLSGPSRCLLRWACRCKPSLQLLTVQSWMLELRDDGGHAGCLHARRWLDQSWAVRLPVVIKYLAAPTAGRAWVLFSRTDLQESVQAIQGLLEWILLSSEQGEYIFFSINLNDASTFKLHILNRFYAISFCWTFALHIVLIHMD